MLLLFNNSCQPQIVTWVDRTCSHSTTLSACVRHVLSDLGMSVGPTGNSGGNKLPCLGYCIGCLKSRIVRNVPMAWNYRIYKYLVAPYYWMTKTRPHCYFLSTTIQIGFIWDWTFIKTIYKYCHSLCSNIRYYYTRNGN